MAKFIDLKSLASDQFPEVGGKAKGLAKLHHFGYKVPDAFVIYDISDDEDFLSARERFTDSGYDLVSVRSSATLEDGDEFSAAGQFQTFLNVSEPDEFVKACRGCMASLHNKNVQEYVRTFLRSGEECRMNIVVQRMVNARCAGVIFSRAPMRPGFSLVEVVPGLGENLVSGKLSAQQYRVREDIVENMPSQPLLTREQALYLGKESRRAEELFGMPMDLEWAMDEEGTIYWLQARPITISESVTMNELDCNLESSSFVYTTGNIGEMMPGAVTPLCLSTNMYALDWGVRQTYIEIGCTGDDVPPYSYIAPFYNHMFFNMTNMYAASHSIFGTTKETMDISICGHVLEGYPDSDMPDKSNWRKFLNTIPFLKIVMSGEAAKKGMDTVVASLKFDLEDDVKGLYGQIIDKFEYLKKAQYYHYLASYYSGGQTNMLSMMVEKDFEDKNSLQSYLAGCLTQIEDFESANILRMMQSLCCTILLEKPDAETLSVPELEDYVEHHSGEAVRKGLEEFMARHGHRGIREPEIMSRPWRDNKASFYSSLKSVLSSMAIQKTDAEKSWTDYADEILSRYKGVKKKLVRSSILKARKGVCYREYTKSGTILVLDRFKQAYRTLSSLMTKAGLLPDEECIWFLLQDEVGELISGKTSVVKKALARRRNFPQMQEMKFPYCQMGVPQPLSPGDGSGDSEMLSGTPVSRGKATGPARIIRSEKDAAKLKKGEIMVAECTDIGWSPYYSIVAGMVTEIGSALSHGVVVAREYSLPTVVNVSDAMNVIHDGDIVTIDGNNGKVIIEVPGSSL